MPQVPIACTLSPKAASDRLSQWREILARGVIGVETDESHAWLTLVAGTESVLTAVSLAEAEKLCCAFFEFSIELDELVTRLHIEVPTDAQPILAGLLQLLPSEARAS